MKNLSQDLEIAIENCIEALDYQVDITEVDSDKLAKLMQSKTDSFTFTKDLIVQWENSQNAPSHAKLKEYISNLVGAGDNAIETLRQALRKKIDFEKVDAEKHGLAVKAKPIIFRAINEINAGVLQLRMQLDADKFDLKAREFTRGYPEKFANQEFFPLKNYHKEWHDEETDSVMLCPFGTKGDIINLDGLNIMLPKVPAKKDILFHKLPKDQQYWKRPEFPKGLTPDNEEVYAEYIMDEFRKRREGVWFYNNGEPIYLTGAHYMALTHIKMLDTGNYMDFRMAQRDMFYFTKACVLDRRSLGELFVKSRRTGFSYQIICEFINDGTMTANAKLGMTSKTGEDAQEAFLKMTYGIQNLPFFFIPVVKGKIDSKSEIEFAKPSDASKVAKKKKESGTDDYLNTMMDWKTTTEGAYDGQRMFRYLIDEASKPSKPFNLITHWGRVSPTINNGGRIVGKIFVGSTVNPMALGGENFFKMFLGSIVSKRNEATNMTPTGLYAYFLPAHKNLEEFTDIYGVCHQAVEKGEHFYNVYGIKKAKGSIQYLEDIRRSKRSQSDILYNEELRANPMTIEEAFRDELSSTLFDMEKINEQISFNSNNNIDDTLVRGNFAWKDGVQDTFVEWQPNTRGRFLMSWLPPSDMRNKWQIRRNTFGGDSKHPLNDDIGAFGCDPYDIDSVVDSHISMTENGSESVGGSKGALHGLTRMTLRDAPSNFFFCEYIARPQTAEIFYEDVLMCCVFYGMPILIESNKIRLLKHFKNRGYRGFSINRFDKVSNRLSPTEKELGGVPSNGEDLINIHWTAIEAYIKKYVGVYSQGEDIVPARTEGEIGSMPFQRTLKDWLKFNVAKRTNYDATISSGLAIMACNRHTFVIQQERKPIKISFRTYSNIEEL